MAGITAAERERRDQIFSVGLKECTRCHTALSIRAFATRHDGYQGLNGGCRRCCRAATADWQRRNPDKTAARVRTWSADNRDRVHEIAREYRCANPDVEDARRQRWWDAGRPERERAALIRQQAKLAKLTVDGRPKRVRRG
jgi:hypothetical protein